MKLLGNAKTNYDEDGNLLTDTKGLSTVEYLILLVVIAVAGISLWTQLGDSIDEKGTAAKSSLDGM